MHEYEKGAINTYKPYGSSDSNQSASAPQVRHPAVQTELETIEKYDREFGELLNILESKLSPVLRSPQAGEVADGRKSQPDVPIATLVGDLQNASARRMRFASHVRDLIDRLEI